MLNYILLLPFILVGTIIYGQDIDAISGATISASSMTKAVANVLISVRLLKKKQILN